ncbi:hypothetical protein [Actinoplanes lobatus]|uniref:Uncharacterized protein n=1 Tax=Actinoplanes lobatus TaxID=113568 RepID=A0A7W7HLR4_9ACTN|nr:hypothetical protein [Actinoplanes lobatus]MBB4752885.1 hypothetical protein [Actinoplanes lobatus]
MRQAGQDRQFGDAGLAGAGGQGDDQVSQILEDPVHDVQLRRPQVDLGALASQQ